MNSWREYFINTKNKPPRTLLVQSAPLVLIKDKALDLGSGALNDVAYLLSQGFKHVIALDKEPIAQAIAGHFPKELFTYCIDDLETYSFPENSFDLISAQYTLPFVKPVSFFNVWKGIYGGLKKGAIFTGQFFGDRDEWVSRKEMTFHDVDSVKKLLSDFEIIVFREEEKKDLTAAGNIKHWHVFHVIARKK